MKKIILIAGIMLAGLATITAQEVKKDKATHRAKTERTQKHTPEQIAAHKVARLEKQAGTLTQEQKAKANAIYLEEAKAMESRAALRKETNQQIDDLLSDDQKANIKVEREKKKTEIKNRRIERGATKSAPGNK